MQCFHDVAGISLESDAVDMQHFLLGTYNMLQCLIYHFLSYFDVVLEVGFSQMTL